MALPKLEGRITVPTGGYSLTVSENGGAAETITIAAGDYYLTSATSLLSTLATQLTNNATLAGTYTVTLDDTFDAATGRVTINCTGGSVTTVAITWSSTELRSILGFTGNLSGTTLYSSTNQARYLWLPNYPRTSPDSPDPSSTSHDIGWEESDFTAAVAPSGASVRLAYNRRLRETFAWEGLLGHRVWQSLEIRANESLQTFWRDVLYAGAPFRYHPARDDDALFWSFWAETAGTFRPAAMIPGWTGTYSKWAISYDCRKLV